MSEKNLLEKASPKIINIDCADRPTAYHCLGARGQVPCDYAEAADCQFICNKPKGQLFGKATLEASTIK